MPLYAGVVIEDVPLSTVYHYRVPPALQESLEPGVRVAVPFGGGNRRAHGFVVETATAAPIPEDRLKDVESVRGEGSLATPEILSLTRWIANYYRCGWGEVLAAAVPVAVRRGAREKTLLHAELLVDEETALREIHARRGRACRQAAALEALLEVDGALPLTEIELRSGAPHLAVRALERDGLVRITEHSLRHDAAPISAGRDGITLTEGQSQALAAIGPALAQRRFEVFLLHGATASGKTEVYLRALEQVLAAGRTGIVLVPEISLTPQTVERFRARVGEVAVLHSSMADGERAEEWRRLRRGEVRVAIGARSAVFSPLPSVGLIIVDEEHERTFKQETSPRYHARDVAVVRAREAGAAVLLGSATPSLESFHNARGGKYRLLSLPERVAGGALPATEVVDMREEWQEVQKQTLVSRRLEKEVRHCLRHGEQAMLFLNRRGFHTWVHCLHCKEVLSCPQCDISLTYHRGENLLRCHYCEHARALPELCPACSTPRLRAAGSGTERVEEVVAGLFPEARLLRMDADTMGGRDAHATALAAFARGEYDILLGTQMIAKGHDFPNVTLIGVLFADGSINLPDFRAAETSFQLVTQVVGRAGRGERPGLGIVQAFDPTHAAVRFAARQDYLGFVEQELADRRAHGYPPFGRLARVLVRGPDATRAWRHAEAAAAALRAHAAARSVLGPAACPISRIQESFRFHILVKAPDPGRLARLLHAGREALVDRGRVRLVVDVDPVSLL